MKKVLPWLIGTIVIGAGAASTYYFGYLPYTQKQWLIANLGTIFVNLTNDDVTSITNQIYSADKSDINTLYQYLCNSVGTSLEANKALNNIGINNYTIV